jgi:hypothetical protein
VRARVGMMSFKKVKVPTAAVVEPEKAEGEGDSDVEVLAEFPAELTPRRKRSAAGSTADAPSAGEEKSEGKRAEPSPKRAKPGMINRLSDVLTHGADLAEPLVAPTDRLSDVPANVDSGMLLDFFADEPSVTGAFVEEQRQRLEQRALEKQPTQAEQPKQSTPAGSGGVRSPPLPLPSAAALAERSEDFCRQLKHHMKLINKKLSTKNKRIADQAKIISSSAPRIKELEEKLEVVTRLSDQRMETLEKETTFRELAQRELKKVQAEVLSVRDELAKVVAERDQSVAKKAELEVLIDVLHDEKAELKGLADKRGLELERVEAESSLKDARLAEKEAELTEKDVFIKQLTDELLPGMISEVRSKAAVGVKETLKQLFPDSSDSAFPWDDFEKLERERYEREAAEAEAEDTAAGPSSPQA